MPIDPRIALGYQAPQIESPINMMLTAQKMQAGQQENALRQAQMENYQAEVARRNALLPHEIAKAEREARAADIEMGSKQTAAQAAYHKQQRDILATINDPQTYSAWRDQYTAAQPWAAQYLPTPEQFTPEVKQQLLLTADEAIKQTVMPQDLGGETRMLRVPTYSGAATIVPGSEAKKTPTPGQELTNQRLREKGVGVATPLLSQAILDGRVPVSRVNSRTAPLFEAALQVDPQADLTALNVGQLGAAAGARTAGTTTANIEIASDEANRMIGVLRDIIPTVNLTNYPSINAVQNAVSRGTGGVEIVKLNTAINSLINSYARAINPRGQPTVSDKNHAREVINNAMSKGQLAGTLEVMEAEMRAALEAATAAGARRGKAGGEKAPSGEPAAAKPSTKKTKSGVAYTVEED